MHSFKPAARRRGRNTGFLLFSVLFSAVSLHGEAASAASLAVKITQLNQGGETQQVTCAAKTNCLLPIELVTGPGQRETLNVHVHYVPGTVLCEFETPKGYLYAGDKNSTDLHAVYETIWHKAVDHNKSSIHDVTLFLPLVPHAEVAPILNAVETPIADLEITTEQVQ